MTPSLERLPTKAKEAPSPHEVRLAPLDTNPVFHSLGEKSGRVKAGSSMSSSRYPMGRLFRITSTSKKTSFIFSKVNLDFPSDFQKSFFVKTTIFSNNPPYHRLPDKLHFQVNCNLRSIMFRVFLKVLE